MTTERLGRRASGGFLRAMGKLVSQATSATLSAVPVVQLGLMGNRDLIVTIVNGAPSGNPVVPATLTANIERPRQSRPRHREQQWPIA
ncbi:hypothetical protein NOCA290074 [metagenome]|uniref:Uncharacterized protein n=1 Tax=metagenome TaxID=256318 RepID=A0A2P2CG48_9ZZZZ